LPYCLALGAILSDIRQQRDLSPSQDYKGTNLDSSSLSRYERGRDKPSIQALCALATLYDVDPFEVLIHAAMSAWPLDDLPPDDRGLLLWATARYDEAAGLRRRG
jgi:transcriptional regulator with XRE-family HTH domain